MQNKLIIFIGQIVLLSSLVFSSNLMARAQSDSKTLESVIESQCLREINDSRMWRNALIMKTQQEQSATKRNICQCVHKEAMQDSSIKPLSSGLFHESEHRDLVSKVVLKSLRTCSQQFLD